MKVVEIKNYVMLKFKCGKCDEGQYYSKGEAIQCPYCGATEGQVLVELTRR